MSDLSLFFFDSFTVFLLVLANGFFVAAEFAIVRSEAARLRSPQFEGKFGVKSALKLIDEIDLSLSSTQLGITIASLTLGWWGEHVLQLQIVSFFDFLEKNTALLISHAIATSIALVLLTFLHVVLGELVAKSLAIRYPEATLRFVADGMLIFARIFSPLLSILTVSANLILRLFGVTVEAESERTLSGAEIAMLVTRSTKGGLLEKNEEEMIHGVIQFSDTVAREVMTPRIDLISVPVNASIDEVLGIVVPSGLSRFPVVEGSVDNVVGILLARDLIQFAGHNREFFSLRKVMREAYFVPNTKPIDDLLSEFKVRKHHMAVVLDEHGGVDGVVTLEDIIEELVGEIYDESDEPEQGIVVDHSGEVLLDGGVLVDDISERFGLSFPDGDFDTIAGFILASLGRVPETGEKLLVTEKGVCIGDESTPPESLDNTPENSSESGEKVVRIVLTVERMDDHRIETVRLQFPHESNESIRELATSNS